MENLIKSNDIYALYAISNDDCATDWIYCYNL